MTKDDMATWMEVGKLVASIATPFVVVILGVILLHRTEGVKSKVAKQSDFHKKWAEQFFECCQEFMRTIERELAILTAYGNLKHPNDKHKTELLKEITQLHTALAELELRIRRSVAFAPSTGLSAEKAAGDLIKLIDKMRVELSSPGVVHFDDIINKMKEFNFASRRAHQEMLEREDT